MKTCFFVLIIILALANFVYADYGLPTIDFFMHSRQHEIFLRDHFRFDEPKPFQIEYNYTKWLDSDEYSSEYADKLNLETDLPIYKSKNIMLNIPFYYERLPIWSENEKVNYGGSINNINLSVLSRLIITNKFRSIIGIEYNIKGNSETFGKADGRMICLPNMVLSYEIFNQLNIMAGGRLEKYFYDTDQTDFTTELSDRLYFQPVAMLNWHPNDNFAFLLGLPYLGGYVSLANGMIKADVRTTLNQRFEAGIRIRPINKTNLAIRFINNPYSEIPVEEFKTEKGNFLEGTLEHTRKTMSFELGRELNPASIVSLGFQYSPESDIDFKSKDNQEYLLNGKSNYSIGVKFTVDIEALLQLK